VVAIGGTRLVGFENSGAPAQLRAQLRARSAERRESRIQIALPNQIPPHGSVASQLSRKLGHALHLWTEAACQSRSLLACVDNLHQASLKLNPLVAERRRVFGRHALRRVTPAALPACPVLPRHLPFQLHVLRGQDRQVSLHLAQGGGRRRPEAATGQLARVRSAIARTGCHRLS
jgi:hypothetical protein